MDTTHVVTAGAAVAAGESKVIQRRGILCLIRGAQPRMEQRMLGHRMPLTPRAATAAPVVTTFVVFINRREYVADFVPALLRYMYTLQMPRPPQNQLLWIHFCPVYVAAAPLLPQAQQVARLQPRTG
jgi:hypothetical protein